VGIGETALIIGIGVSDTIAKPYLARAIGPGLAAFGLADVVPDPRLAVYSATRTELLRNSGWETSARSAELVRIARSLGAFPLASGSLDSALTADLAPGAYTLEVTTPSGQPGAGLAELYELDANGRTTHLSTRVFVRSGDGAYTGGFVVTGPAYKRMLVRAVGPTLTTLGIEHAMANPVLTLFSGSDTVATNDRWEAGDNAGAIAAAGRMVGAFTLQPGSEDAALLVTLRPGAYTFEVKGRDTAEGEVLFEIYDVP
jgi:hypothetical protein